MNVDCRSLEDEMQMAGIVAWRDWNSAGRATTQDRPLTPQEQTTVQAVLAAHDQTKRERDEATARQALRDLADRMEAGTATAQETRIGLAKLIRRMVR